MSNWKEYILGDLGYTYAGLSGKNKNDFGKGKPYIPYLNIFTNSRVDPSFLDYVEIKQGEKQNTTKYGDLLFTTSSETVEEVGMTSVLLDDLKEAYLNSFCFGFRLVNFEVLLPEFARFLFRSEIVRKRISDLGQGSTRFNLPKTELLQRLKLKIPSKPMQRKVAEILCSVEAVIEKAEQAIAKYKCIRQGMLYDLFTRGIGGDGKLRPTGQQAPELYKHSALGMIPKEWEEDVLSAIADIINGGTPSTSNTQYWDGGIPWLSVEDFNTGKRYVKQTVKTISKDGLKNSATNLLPADAIIISARGTVGVIAQLFSPMAFNQSCYGIVSKDKTVSNNYIYYYLLFHKTYRSFSSFGSVFNTIIRNYFDELFVPKPKKGTEVQKIVEVLSNIDTKIEKEQEALFKYQSIKQALMTDLLTGKKEVKINEELVSAKALII